MKSNAKINDKNMYSYQRIRFFFRNEFMISHGGKIPEDQLFVKISGDHGKGSMKFAFQLANLKKPNSSKKTVVFAIFEGKDTRNNLGTVTKRYRDQLVELEMLKWQ